MVISFPEIRYHNSLPYILRPNQFEIDECNVSQFRTDLFAEVSNECVLQILHRLNTFGCAVGRFSQTVNPLDLAKKLEPKLGLLMRQTRNPLDLSYNVEYLPGIQKNSYQLNSNKAQPMHTDGHYESKSPDFIALYCCSQSILGGFSQLVSAASVYNYISGHSSYLADLMFEKDLIHYYRKNPAGEGFFDYAKPFFYRDGDKIGINYNPIMYEIKSLPMVEYALRMVNYFTNNPKNQIVFCLKPDEVLIINNGLFLHGRTAFPDNTMRKMVRLWFRF